MKTALVTGSAGFVGRHMVDALNERGIGVYTNDIKTGAGGDCRNWFKAWERDQPQIDLVVHCAAVVGGRAFIEQHPLELASIDLQLDAALFEWALKAKPGRIVYFSSSAAYPVSMQADDYYGPMREDLIEDWGSQNDLLVPDQTYGWVKLTGEYLAHEANAEGIKTHVFRPFSGYGADQDLEYPFPMIMERVRNRPKQIEIWSDAVRDWVHIDDVVGAVMAAIDQDFLGPVNICTGAATSMSQLARRGVDQLGLFGYDPPVVVKPGMPRGVHYRVGDPTLMKAFYEPKITIEEGIRRALSD